MTSLYAGTKRAASTRNSPPSDSMMRNFRGKPSVGYQKPSRVTVVKHTHVKSPSDRLCTDITVSNARAPPGSDKRVAAGQLVFTVSSENNAGNTVLSLQSVNQLLSNSRAPAVVLAKMVTQRTNPDPNSRLGENTDQDVTVLREVEPFNAETPNDLARRIHCIGVAYDTNAMPSTNASRGVGSAVVQYSGVVTNGPDISGRTAMTNNGRVFYMANRWKPDDKGLSPMEIRACHYDDELIPHVAKMSSEDLISYIDLTSEAPLGMTDKEITIDLLDPRRGVEEDPWSPPRFVRTLTVFRPADAPKQIVRMRTTSMSPVLREFRIRDVKECSGEPISRVAYQTAQVTYNGFQAINKSGVPGDLYML